MVLPVAAVAEKPGTFVNWEGRIGTFEAVLDVPGVESDLHVLRRIADEMDVHLGLPDAAAARRELAAPRRGERFRVGRGGGFRRRRRTGLSLTVGTRHRPPGAAGG